MTRAKVIAALAAGLLALLIAPAPPSNAEFAPDAGTGTLRLSGSDRYATAVAVSKKFFTGGQQAVFVASGETFPDALAGGPAAALLRAPILLVQRTKVPAVVATELARLKPARTYILGGTGAVSDDVLRAVARSTGGQVERIYGSTRYETATKVATKFFRNSTSAFLVSGEGYADALAAGVAAGRADAPLLLTTKASLPSATRAYLASYRPDYVVVVGGTGAVAHAVLQNIVSASPRTIVTRYAGKDRYSTAAKVAHDWFGDTPSTVFHAPGTNFADALAAAPVAVLSDAPVLLTSPTCAPRPTAQTSKHSERKIGVGGTAVTYLGSAVCGGLPKPICDGAVVASLRVVQSGDKVKLEGSLTNQTGVTARFSGLPVVYAKSTTDYVMLRGDLAYPPQPMTSPSGDEHGELEPGESLSFTSAPDLLPGYAAMGEVRWRPIIEPVYLDDAYVCGRGLAYYHRKY